MVGSEKTDNEIKALIVSAINDYFSVENWDFGESFYYTELSAYIHQTLTTHLSSVVIVPTGGESKFGNLFEIKAEADELFLSVATVSDIEIVKAFTEQNLRVS